MAAPIRSGRLVGFLSLLTSLSSVVPYNRIPADGFVPQFKERP
jgi:hypothetical protein